MKILASETERLYTDMQFSKNLFTEVSDNLVAFTEEEWKSYEGEYKKILIAPYIRTDIDNLVLLVDKDKFANITDVPFRDTCWSYPNFLIDAGLMCGKNLIDSAFEFKSPEAMKRFVANSTCYPVGAVNTSKEYVLAFNVVISERLLRDPEISLKQGFHFSPIESLNLTDSLQKAISESLIIIKSEDKK